MSRIRTLESIAASPAASQPLLTAVSKQLGSVPNLFRVVANSPAALEGYLGLSGALAKGVLPRATQERIAVAIASLNGCDYCLAAHCYLAKAVAKLDDAEIAANRAGESKDARANAALRFAVNIARARGQIAPQDLADVKEAGYSDAEIVEIIAHVGMNTLTNYVNNVAGTIVDFPPVPRS